MRSVWLELKTFHSDPGERSFNDLIVKCFFDEADMGTIDLLDMQGAVVKRFMANEQINRGYSVFTYSVSGVAAGTYSLRMQTLQRVFSQKIVVVH